MKIFGFDISRNKPQPIKDTVPPPYTQRGFTGFPKKQSSDLLKQMTREPDQAKSNVRGFDAAKQTDTNRDWFSPTTSINGMLVNDLDLMRARCRERMRNDDYAKNFARVFAVNVIGHNGIRLQAQPMNIDGSRDQLAADAIEAEWKKYTNYAVNFDVTERMNMKDFMNLAAKTLVTDGELFIRKIIGSEGGKYGIRWQLIDPALCDVKYNDTAVNGNRIIGGIEIDVWNRPTAYYFLTAADGSQRRHTRIDAKEITHRYIMEFPEQMRGIPPLAVSLQRLKMLSAYEEAALTNARISAAKMGFYTRPADEIDPATTIDADGELIEEVAPGQFSLLPQGYSFESFDSRYPDGEIIPFKKNMLRAVAGGLGVDYPTLGQDMESVNLSSARVAIYETREMWKGVQQWFIDNLMSSMYESWLEFALRKGLIRVANRPLSVTNIDKFKEVVWQPRRWVFPDPLRDSKANVAYIEQRIKAPSTIAAEMGIDFDTEAKVIARDEDLLESLGLQRIGSATPDPEEEQMIQESQQEDNSSN